MGLEKGNEMKDWQVYRDGEPISPVLTESDALAWLLLHQPRSVDWACKYDGYELKELT